MPKGKAQPKECGGCKLRDERIAILERLVGLFQFEQKRRAAVEIECDTLVTRANALEEKQHGEVKPDGD